jgi:hypothetical protein
VILGDRALAVEVIAIFTALTFRSFLSTPLTFHAALAFLSLMGYAELVRREHKYRRTRA